MEIGDIFQMRFINQVNGVATSNAVFFEVMAINGQDDLNTIVDAIGARWWSRFSAQITTECALTALIYRNQSRTEQAVVFPSLVGGSASSAHPQYSVVRINTYAQDQTTDPVYRGAANISGFRENGSSRGRMINADLFSSLQTFFLQVQTSSPTGIDYRAVLRRQLTPPPTPTYEYIPYVRAQANPTLFVLKSRKRTLIGT